ncbi:MAG: energy transducer TonB [Myxococcota bacterium]
MATALPTPPEDRTLGILVLALLGSLLFHGVGIPGFMAMSQALGWLTPPERNVVPPPMDIEVLEVEEPEPEPEPPPPEAEEVEPEVPEEPDPPPRPQNRDPAPEEPAPEPETPEPPPEEPPPPLDLTGITLGGETGSFTVNAGNGQDREGPIAPPGPRQTAPGGMGTGGAGGEEGGTGPRVVAPSNLSREPGPYSGARADLAQCITRNYPDQARTSGVEGRVDVTLRIQPSGRIARVRVGRESPGGYGFARVCQRCYRGLRPWSAPLDRRGEPVATDISAFCGFTVRD